MSRRGLTLLATTALASLLGGVACAADAPSGGLEGWVSSVTLSGHVEAGATMNPITPDNGVNFGHLFSDRANQLVLNQAAVTVERTPDPKAAGVDFGFRLNVMYGADSRFTHFLGLGDHPTSSRNSFDMVDGYVDAHAPVLTSGGIDVKLGLFATPLGYEVIDPTGNFFYSKSYIFNFGIPLKHSGLLTTTHFSHGLDLYLGYTTGVNTSFGVGGGYNDKEPHILAGFGLNLDRVTILALTHAGPENPAGSLPPGVNIHGQMRYLNDVVVNWKVTDRLTSVTELNYVRDDGLRADGGGIAEYLTYPLSPVVTAGLRAEVWRDAKGAFVGAYPGNLDYLNAEEGRPNASYSGGPATYGALTLGLNIRPSRLPAAISGLTVRPELRYDRVLSSGAPFGARPGTGKDQVTIGLDVVAPFAAGPAGRPRDESWMGSAPLEPAKSASEGGAPSRRVGPSLAGPRAIAALDSLEGPSPNVGVESAIAGPGSTAFTVRGLGDAEAEGPRDPAVGLLVDGVALDPALGRIIDGFDLADVAVEKGPAGLFEGREAVGGVVSVSRTRPTRRWGLDLDYGLQQGYHADVEKMVLNLPVGDAAGLKLALTHQRRGGYFNNVYSGDGLYGRDELTTGALRLDWNLTPRLEADLSVTLTNDRGQGAPVALGDPLAARLHGGALAATHPGLGFNAYGSPFISGATAPLGVFQVASDYGDRAGLVAGLYSLKLSYAAPFGRFSAQTAYVDSHETGRQDLDGGCAISDLGGRPCGVMANPNVGVLHVARDRTTRQFTEELRFARDFGDKAALLAGLYYFRRDSDGGRTTFTAPFEQRTHDVSESKAAFARLTLTPTSRLTVSAGLRYVDTHSDDSAAVGPVSGPLAASRVSIGADRVLSRFDLDYRLTGGLTLHADRATGLRAGGQAPDAVGAPGADLLSFRPEHDTNYELGLRATALAGRFTAHLTGFVNEVNDHQLTEVVATPGYGAGYNTYVVNLPKVEIRGAELEASYRPALAPSLTLTGAGGYQDARVVRGAVAGVQAPLNPDGTAGPPGSVYDLSGSQLRRAPRFNAALRADYAWRLGPGQVDFDVSYRWSDRYGLADLAGQSDVQAPLGRVDLSVSYSRRFYRFSVITRNLTNAVYLTHAQPALFTHGWGDPRTVLVEAAARF